MIRDLKHLRFIASLPCVVCGQQAEPHHLLRGVERGMGMKASDSETIPLCHEHHMELHGWGDEEAFLGQFNINGVVLAEYLWEHTGEEVTAKAIIASQRMPA